MASNQETPVSIYICVFFDYDESTGLFLNILRPLYLSGMHL